MNTMHLKELLQQDHVASRNVQLKKAFNALNEPVCIDGIEIQAIHILANLTIKLSDTIDVTSQTEAYRLLRSESWLSKCVDTVKFRHTHNLKYPNYKNRGALRLKPLGNLPSGYLSSQRFKGNNQLGWSQNSADINYQLFFCASFYWQGSLHSIAELIYLKHSDFQNLLHAAGMHKKDYLWIEKALQQISPMQTIHELGSELRQIRLPYQDNYCALSPVPAHGLQREIHLTLKNERRRKCVMTFSRAASVGNLTSAAAGKLFVLKTLPRQLRMKHTREPYYELAADGLLALEQLTQADNLLLTENNRKRLIAEWEQVAQQYIAIWKHRNWFKLSTLDTRELVEWFNAHLSTTQIGRRLAYRPEVTKQLNSLFNRVSEHKFANTEKKKVSQFILLPGIRISGASAVSSAYTVGLPSLMGMWGFLHAFERNIRHQMTDHGFFIDSFALCLHSFSLDERGLTKEGKFDQNRIITPAILPTCFCDLTVSFVLKIRAERQQYASTQLFSCLPNSLCQGSVHPQIDLIKQSGYFESFYQAALMIPEKKGCWLTPNRRSISDDLSSVLAEPSQLLTTVGYHLLETPTQKLGALDNLPHAFSEPIIGRVNQHHVNFDALEVEFFWKLAVLPNAFLLGVEESENEITTEI